MRPNTSLAALCAVGCVMGSTACSSSSDSTYDFALLGDNPYPAANVPKFRALIDDVNALPHLQWVIHVGDIRGGVACSDEVLRDRFELYQGFAVPFVYTPGDNDWFDCGAETVGGYDELERLAFLRGLFFPDPTRTTGGRSMAIRSQREDPLFEEFVENAMWTHGDVVYATVHLVGLSGTAPTSDPGSRRMDAALAWIEGAFDLARETGSVAVFIATQADPWVAWGARPLLQEMCETCLNPRPGLEPLYPALVRHADAYSGQVVLAVGDTHIFRVDKPLYRDDGTLVENFTRVETFGNPYVHWVRVRVDSSSRQVFTFYQQLVPANLVTTDGR